MQALWAVGLTFIFAAFSGCVSDPEVTLEVPPTDVPANLLKDGRDLRTELLETDEIAQPDWTVGDWFGHHVFFTGGPDAGMHIESIVVADSGNSWFLATSDRQMAKIEAAYDIPILGKTAKKDLSSTGFGGVWEPYDFPLKHGKTWTREVLTGDTFGGSDKVKVTYESTYNAAISTPDGDRPGFDITGRTETGDVMFQYDFVPDIQWYAHYYAWNLRTEDPKDFDFHVMSMGHGQGWTGTYYVDSSKPLLETVAGVAVDPDAPTEPWLQPDPYKSFTVANGVNYVFGFAGAGAFAGASELVLIDPTNKHYEYRAVDSSLAGAEDGRDVDLPGLAGEWKIVKHGAGAAIWNYVFLYAITETEAKL